MIMKKISAMTFAFLENIQQLLFLYSVIYVTIHVKHVYKKVDLIVKHVTQHGLDLKTHQIQPMIQHFLMIHHVLVLHKSI
jgi:hypothetical protein